MFSILLGPCFSSFSFFIAFFVPFCNSCFHLPLCCFTCLLFANFFLPSFLKTLLDWALLVWALLLWSPLVFLFFSELSFGKLPLLSSILELLCKNLSLLLFISCFFLFLFCFVFLSFLHRWFSFFVVYMRLVKHRVFFFQNRLLLSVCLLSVFRSLVLIFLFAK